MSTPKTLLPWFQEGQNELKQIEKELMGEKAKLDDLQQEILNCTAELEFLRSLQGSGDDLEQGEAGRKMIADRRDFLNGKKEERECRKIEQDKTFEDKTKTFEIFRTYITLAKSWVR